MSACRTIVSGGTGFAGRFVVESLLEAGHEVTVLGRRPPPEGFFSRAVAFRGFTLEAHEVCEAHVAGGDFLVHAAFDHLPGRYRGGEGDDRQGFRRRNLDGSLALFDAARRAGVKRIVFLSSRAVYGPHEPGTRLREDMLPAPDTLYGEVKRAAEQALAAISDSSMAGASLRATGVYGPAGRGRAHKWEALFGDALAGRPIPPRAGTEVHGRDLAAAVRLMLERPAGEVAGRVFNVSDILVDRRDLLAVMQRMTGRPEHLPAAADKAAVNVMETGALENLGWRPGGMELFASTVEELVADFMRRQA